MLPYAGKYVDDGSFETDEEQKLRNESRKILDIPDLQVSGTCVRVPVFTGPLAQHQRRVRPADQRRRGRSSCSAAAPGVELMRHPDTARGRRQGPQLRRPHPPGRRSIDGGRGLALFLSNDNLRKGAALNAVQIAELLI